MVFNPNNDNARIMPRTAACILREGSVADGFGARLGVRPRPGGTSRQAGFQVEIARMYWARSKALGSGQLRWLMQPLSWVTDS